MIEIVGIARGGGGVGQWLGMGLDGGGHTNGMGSSPFLG